MSEDTNKEPMKKTSAVPLRKETVRVTLKATPEPSATAPTAPPAPTGMSTGPIAAPPAPTALSAPPTPLPSASLKTSGASSTNVPAPPTIALASHSGSSSPAPAPTIQLNTPKAVAGVGAAAPLVLSGAPTQPLPRATTAQPSSISDGEPAAAQSFDYAEEESGVSEGIVSFLSIAALVIALIALSFQLMTANIWLEGDWGRIFG